MAALSAAPIPDLSEESDELDEPDLSDEEPDWLDESSVLSLESLWELSLELSGELDASAFLAAFGFLLLGQFAHFGADNTHMRLRFVQRTDCDALAQLVTPCLRQVRGGDIGGLHFVRKLKSKEIGRHATINGHGAVAIST